MIWLVIVVVVVLPIGIAVGVLWTSRRTRGDHSQYDPAFSVSAVATRIIREAARRKSEERTRVDHKPELS